MFYETKMEVSDTKIRDVRILRESRNNVCILVEMESSAMLSNVFRNSKKASPIKLYVEDLTTLSQDMKIVQLEFKKRLHKFQPSKRN